MKDVQGSLFLKKHPHHTKAEFERIKATTASLLSQGHDRHRVSKALSDLGFKKASGDPIDADYVSQIRYKLERDGFPWKLDRLPASGVATEDFWRPSHGLKLVVGMAALATALAFVFMVAH